MTPKTRGGKSRQFYPNIEYRYVVFLDHHLYPERTDAMNTAYSFFYNFKKYLNNAQEAFADVALFLPTVQLDITNHIKHSAINTGDKDRIKHIMDTKTNLMADVAKDRRTRLKNNANTITRALNFLSKSETQNTLFIYINWSPVYIDNRQPARDIYDFVYFSDIPFPLPVVQNDNNVPPPLPDPNIVHLFTQSNDILHQQNVMIQQLAPKPKTHTSSIKPFVQLNFSA